jgi:hypothetical protein
VGESLVKVKNNQLLVGSFKIQLDHLVLLKALVGVIVNKIKAVQMNIY